MKKMDLTPEQVEKRLLEMKTDQFLIKLQKTLTRTFEMMPVNKGPDGKYPDPWQGTIDSIKEQEAKYIKKHYSDIICININK